LSEDLEVWDWVCFVGEPWVNLVLVAEFQPQVPYVGGFFGASGNDSGSDRRLDKAEIIKEIISGLGWHPIHGEGWGKTESKWVRKSSELRSNKREALSAIALLGPGM
jgi:hypothetical protein